MNGETKLLDQQELKKLALRMLVNHVQASLEYEKLDRDTIQKIIKNDPSQNQFAERTVVAIVGAGASTPAGLPTSQDAINQLQSRLGLPEDIVEYELNRLESVYRLNRDAFETNLLAFSIFSGHKLRNELQNIFFRKHPPILCYEILAHLLNHRFLDAIINFNFDELLDQSIEDELGEGEFYKIVSDGDCPEILLNEVLFDRYNFRSDLPVYIKPHGTASHKSTLRFTRDDYFGLPNDIRRVIRNLLVLPKRPLTIVSIGFSMQSFEFNHIIKESSRKSEIFYINKVAPKPEPELHNYEQKLISVSDEETLNECLETLWMEVHDSFREGYIPRGIDRHLLICEIFKGCNIPENDELSTKMRYLKNRTKIELLLSIAKAKGLINMSDLSSDRCGKYYDLYYKEAGSKSHNVKTLTEICSDFGFVETEYGHEFLRWNEGRGEDNLFDTNKLILKIGEFQKWLNSIFTNVEEISTSCRESKLGEQLIGFLKSLIDKIYDPEETEIKIRQSTLYNKIFKAPEVLKTKTALKLNTLELLGGQWTKLALVAETGAWLLKENIVELIKEKNRMEGKQLHICIIAADLTFKEDLKKEYSFCKIRVIKLNWWEHNRHMTIFMDSNDRPIASIYFVRRLRSPRITPMRLNREDSEVILPMFCAYWEKTKTNEQKTVNYKEFQDVQQYLQKLWQSSLES